MAKVCPRLHSPCCSSLFIASMMLAEPPRVAWDWDWRSCATRWLSRLEEIFARQGFEIARSTQSVWCGAVADLVEPLYQRMAERVRASHVVATDDTVLPMLSVGKTQSARMWVYVGDPQHPYNVFDFTLNRGRDGPQQFLQEYQQVQGE